MNKKLIKAAVIGALFSVAPMSFAADEVEDIKAPSMLDEFSFSANVGLYSDYVFRGYTQTQNEPAIQGGFDVEHSSGLYAGTWASNVDWTTAGGFMDKNSVEIDAYAGWATELPFGGLGLDIGVLQFYYPGNNTAGMPDTDATEVYAGLSKDFLDGKFSASLMGYVVVSDEAWGFADMDGETYIDLTVDVPIGSTPLTVSGHVGHQTFSDQNDGLDWDYTDWKVNVDYAFNDNFSAGAFYTGTDQDKASWTVGTTYLGDDVFGGYLSAGF
ncbi:TorF family putative porin [Methylophilaceae bacterium]|nr:TorF family putative porin [Methylophilaceae bacterium]